MSSSSSNRVQPSKSRKRSSQNASKDVVIIDEEDDDGDDIVPTITQFEYMPAPCASIEVVLGIATVATVAIVYISTIFQDLPGGDSGELAGMTCALGAAHPPGYPLLVLLGHLWLRLISKLPTTLTSAYSAAYLLNLFNIIIATGASAALYIFILSVQHPNVGRLASSMAATLGTFCFSFSPLVWEHSVGYEVFALNHLLCISLLYLTNLCLKYKRDKYVAMGAFVCGLGLCNQHTMVLFEAPLILTVLWFRETSKTGNGILTIPNRFRTVTFRNISKSSRYAGAVLVRWCQYTIAFTFGLAPYTQTMVAGWPNMRPYGSWGNTGTIQGLFKHFLRADYGTLKLFPGEESLDGTSLSPPRRVMLYVTEILNRHVPPGSLFLVSLLIGIIAPVACYLGPATTKPVATVVARNHARKNRMLKRQEDSQRAKDHAVMMQRIVLLCLVFYVVVFSSLSNMPIDTDTQPHLAVIRKRFWLQPHICVCTLAASGFAYLWAVIRDMMMIPEITTRVRRSVVIAVMAVFACVWMAGAVEWTMRTYEIVHATANGLALSTYREQMLMMGSLPERSVIITAGDMEWTSAMYLQHCQGLRPDIAVLNIALMTQTWFPHAQEKYAPLIKFPGKTLFLDSHVSTDTTFTLYELVASLLNDEPDRHVTFTSAIERWPSMMTNDGASIPNNLALELVPLGAALRVCLARSACPPLKLASAPSTCADEPIHCSWPVGSWEWFAQQKLWKRIKTNWESAATYAISHLPSEIELLIQTTRQYESLLEDTEVFDPKDTSSMRVNYGVMLYKAASVAAHHPQRVQHHSVVNVSCDSKNDNEDESINPELALMTAVMQLWSNEVYNLEQQSRIEARAAAKRTVQGAESNGSIGESVLSSHNPQVMHKQNVHASLEQVKHIVRNSQLIAAKHLVNGLG